MNEGNSNSWTEYSQYILMELKRLNNKLDHIEKEVLTVKVDQKSTELLLNEVLTLRNEHTNLKTKVITLEVRAAIYGSVAGFIVTGIGLLISYVK